MGTVTQQTLVKAVDTRVGTAERAVADKSAFISQALLEFSRYSSRVAIIEITGDGTDEYVLPSPWLDGFSSIEKVRAVTNATSSTDGFNVAPTYLNSDEYRLDHTTNGTPQIHLNWSPSTSDLLVLKATALHTVTGTTAGTTIPDHQEGAFADLAASLLLEAAATVMLSTQAQDTGGDFIVPQVQLAQGYQDQASRLRDRFNDFFGIDSTSGAGTSAPVLLTKDIDAGRRKARERLTHPRRVW